MIYQYQYEISAIIVITAIVFITLIDHDFSSKRKSTFMALISATAVSAICDIWSCLAMLNEGASRFSLYLSTGGYFVFLHSLPAIFLMYLIYVFNGDSIKKVALGKKLVKLTVIINLVVFGFCSFTEFPFYFDENNNYCHSNIWWIICILPMALIISTFVYIYKGRQKLNNSQIIVLYTFMFAVLTATVIQIVMPEILLTNLTCSVLLLFIYLSFENTAGNEFLGTRAYNMKSFVTSLDRYLNDGENRTIIVCRILNYEKIFRSATQSQAEKYVKKIAIRLSDMFYRRTYFLTNDTFVIVRNTRDEYVIQEDIDRITELVTEGFCLSAKPKVGVFTFKVEHIIEKKDDIEALVSYINEKAFKASDDNEEGIRKYFSSFEKKKEILEQVSRKSASNEVHISYKPIVAIDTGKISSVEIRTSIPGKNDEPIWEYELLSIALEKEVLDEFIEAEIRQICRLLLRNNGIFLNDLKIEIVFPPLQLLGTRQMEKWIKIIEENGIRLERFRFCFPLASIKEFDMDEIGKILLLLNQKDIESSFIEYGMDNVDLKLLRQVRVSCVRIMDEFFLEGMKDSNTKEILLSIIDMLKRLKIDVVIDGIQNAEQLKIAKEMKVKAVSGNLFGESLDLSEILTGNITS